MFVVRVSEEDMKDAKFFISLSGARKHAVAAKIAGETAHIYQVPEEKNVYRARHQFEMEEFEPVEVHEPLPNLRETERALRTDAERRYRLFLEELGI